MADLFEYPERVTLQPDGSYRWKCEISKNYEQHSYRVVMIVCAVISLFLLIFGSFFYIRYQDWKPLVIITACVAVFLIIAFLICLLFARLPGNAVEFYHLADTYIQTGYGRARASFSFRHARQLTISRSCVELKGSVGGVRIYAAEEDLPFIRNYLLCRIPGDAEVLYDDMI